MRSIFFAPDCDDETLFGAFTILKHRPRVVICCQSPADYGSTEERFKESKTALTFLTYPVAPALSMLVSADDLEGSMRALDTEYQPEVVWAPSEVCSHRDHIAVGRAASLVFGSRLRRYDTYTVRNGVAEKERNLPRVHIERSEWVPMKLLALAAYDSQIRHPAARQFFLMDLYEYAEQP